MPEGSGPIPKRSTERRRRNRSSAVETIAAHGVVGVPNTPTGLHPLAEEWFESLKTSGQSQFYEPSDWAAAKVVAEAITKTFNSQRFSAISFSAVWAAMSELLTTEGARRRARMEVERAKAVEEAPPGVTKLAAFRRKGA